jgi:transmembrane sensor
MNARSDQPKSSDTIAAEAERWFARQDHGFSAAEADEFARWRAASPAHVAEFDRLAATWRTADLLKTNPQLAALTARREAAAVREVVARRRRRARILWSSSLAAAAAITLVLVQPWRRPSDVATGVVATNGGSVQVRPAEARRVALPDGSVVQLRGNSEVQPEFTPSERRVRLVRGEAHFTVQKDPSRPFVVQAQGLGVRAVGTAFNVQLTPAAIDVLVTEGTVALHEQSDAASLSEASSALEAGAGHRAKLSMSAGRAALGTVAITAVSTADVDHALAWQFAGLTFRRATLADAVAAFNEQAGTRFELADPNLHSRQISGTFTVNQADAFVRLLEQAAEVRVERSPDGRVRLHAAP